MDDTQTLLDQYYQSLKDKTDAWTDLWLGDGVFSDASKTLHAEGKDAVIASFTPFLKGVNDVSITGRIVEGSNACYIVNYTYVNKSQDSMQQKVAEVWQTEDGRLKELTIYFDLTAYRNFLQG
jgi:hypothetical protein